MKQSLRLCILVTLFATATLSQANVPSAAAIEQAVAQPNVQVQQQGKLTTVVSPRTGVSYTLSNASTRDIIFKAEAIEAVNTATIQRIVATNPAISVESQQQAQQHLLNLVNGQ